MKRSRYGIKVYKLCCEQYTLNFRIYFGKDERQNLPGNVALGKLDKIVLDLVQRYVNKGYILYTDRLYTNPLLYNELLMRNIGACGTVKPNKKYKPTTLVSKVMAKKSREVSAYRNRQLLAIKYADKKPVYVLTTVYDHSVNQVQAREKGQGVIQVDKPVAITEYNRNMGGVDKTDAIIQTYKSARKSMKWTKKLVFYILQHATLNAHYLHLLNGGSQTYMQFMLDALKEILLENQAVGQPAVNDDGVRLTQRHFIYRIPPTARTPRTPRSACCQNPSSGSRHSGWLY